MTDSDQPGTTERRIASQVMKAMEADAPQPAMDGLNDAPTSPRENPPIDEGRVARSHEDYHRILGG